MDAGAAPRRDWVFWSLLAAALLSRLGWGLWFHPPHEHVWSDMAHYVHRAQLVASGRVEPGMRMMVWQAWGTHAVLAIPLVLLGPGRAALEFAGLMWVGFSTATVMLGHALARRVLPGPADAGRVHWPAAAVGLALLVWFPLLSHTGFFISETPYTCVLLATTLGVVRVLQDQRGALATGCWGALAFALRPQSAVFFVLLIPLGLLWYRRVRDPWLRRAALLIAIPLAIVLAISLVRVRVYTGAFGGVAEAANMNLTAGRCHNIVTRAWSSEEDIASWRETGSPLPDRRVSLPGFRALAREGDDHPLALRPALGGEAIDMIGYVGDRDAHREIRRRCYAATGVLGQLRYSVTNVALLWVVARPWPESADQRSPELLPVAITGRRIAAALAPLALLGLVFAMWSFVRSATEPPAEASRRAGLAVCAIQFSSLLLVAAVFFGSPRLRTPYDPYALILVVALTLELGRRLRQRFR